MKRTLLVLLLLLALPASAGLPGVQTLPGGEAGVTSGDPCASTGITKSSVSVAITTVTTTQIVAISGTTTVYVCGFAVSTTGATTATTFQFEYGGSTTCTSPIVLTGTLGANATATAAWTAVAGPTLFKSASGAGLCIVSTGTTVSIQGVVTYVQM
jgi:hypothetical protein